MPKKLITQGGLKKIKEELEYLRNIKRKEIAQRLEQCISFGDLSENSEYFEAKEAQAFLEGRIRELEDIIESAVIAPDKIQNGVAQIGSTVLVTTDGKEEKFKIVGAAEASPFEGKVSIDSPFGQAVLDKPVGAVVTVETPQGKTKYRIIKVE